MNAHTNQTFFSHHCSSFLFNTLFIRYIFPPRLIQCSLDLIPRLSFCPRLSGTGKLPVFFCVAGNIWPEPGWAFYHVSAAPHRCSVHFERFVRFNRRTSRELAAVCWCVCGVSVMKHCNGTHCPRVRPGAMHLTAIRTLGKGRFCD